jgi:hypothetical protein
MQIMTDSSDPAGAASPMGKRESRKYLEAR